MSETPTQKTPPVLDTLWWHEVVFLALAGYALYHTGVEFRGSPWPVIWFGGAVVAAIGVLAFRCREEWNALPNKFFFFGLAAVWTGMFTFLGNSTFGYLDSNSIFAWAFDIYSAPESDDQFALFIPFTVLALLWWKRKELAETSPQVWWPSIFFVAAGLFTHLVGYVVQQPRLSYIAFFIGLYGLIGLAWGKQWLKRSLFPYFLVLFCVPAPGVDTLTFKMRLLVSWIVTQIAHLGLAPDLIRDGTQLYDGQRTFAYDVAAACSGIRSLTALLALTAIYSFMVFKSPRKRLAMIASAFPLAILGNVMRLCFTIAVAEVGGQAAGKAVEQKAGFVTFGVAIAGIYFLGRWLERPEMPKPEAAT
ncbi:MAG TPA: exosortase/archaeosortase family protein [Candidatus Sulfotelmatobacter sp.]|nr:exosortase/archaeosortase family protein [Candidatus Sulfotelmatobacter sp.]